MNKLLITLLLISPFSFADWGVVYYCQMTHLSYITLEGERTDSLLQKFTFKLDKTKNAMVFGKGDYFNDEELELREVMSWPSIEIWYAKDKYSVSYFKEGKFLFTIVTNNITSISADCDKF